LERDEMAVRCDARGVARMPPWQLRIPVDGSAVRERLGLGGLAHHGKDIALAGLAGDEAAAVAARARGKSEKQKPPGPSGHPPYQGGKSAIRPCRARG